MEMKSKLLKILLSDWYFWHLLLKVTLFQFDLLCIWNWNSDKFTFVFLLHLVLKEIIKIILLLFWSFSFEYSTVIVSLVELVESFKNLFLIFLLLSSLSLCLSLCLSLSKHGHTFFHKVYP